MIYELWDSSSGNAVAGFSMEDEAIAVVRAELDAGGQDAVSGWFLRKTDTRGRTKRVVDGAELIKRALAAGPPKADA